MVRARAIVDSSGPGTFLVEVWGEKPHDYVRLYDINATDKNEAAKEGLKRFIAEFEAKDQKGQD